MDWKRPMMSRPKTSHSFTMKKIKNNLPRNKEREIMLKVTREEMKKVLEEMNDSDSENDEEVRKDRIDPKFTKGLARIYELDKELNYMKCFRKFRNSNA